MTRKQKLFYKILRDIDWIYMGSDGITLDGFVALDWDERELFIEIASELDTEWAELLRERIDVKGSL